MKFRCRHESIIKLIGPPSIIMVFFIIVALATDSGDVVLVGVFSYLAALLYSFSTHYLIKNSIELKENELVISTKNWFQVNKEINIKWSDVESYEVGTYNGNNIKIKDINKSFRIVLNEVDSDFSILVQKIQDRVEKENTIRSHMSSKINQEEKGAGNSLIEKKKSPFESMEGKLIFGVLGLIGLIAGIWNIGSGNGDFRTYLLIGLGVSLIFNAIRKNGKV